MLVPSRARWSPFFTDSRPGNSWTGTSEALAEGALTVTVGPVPAAVATALSLPEVAWTKWARRKVTLVSTGSVLPMPKPLILNFVITPETGAPPEYGSPLGSLGWMKETSVHGLGKLWHSPEFAGS